MNTASTFILILAVLGALFALSIVAGAILNQWHTDASKRRNVLDKWD